MRDDRSKPSNYCLLFQFFWAPNNKLLPKIDLNELFGGLFCCSKSFEPHSGRGKVKYKYFHHSEQVEFKLKIGRKCHSATGD